MSLFLRFLRNFVNILIFKNSTHQSDIQVAKTTRAGNTLVALSSDVALVESFLQSISAAVEADAADEPEES